MDVKVNYRVTGSTASLADKIRGKIQSQIVELVQNSIDDYLTDLENHMGTISGADGYTHKNLRWTPLDEETMDDSPKFWYESGEAKDSIVAQVRIEGNRVTAFAGVLPGSAAYQKVLWNELGFTPSDGKLVRRPLFLPLADLHMVELNARLSKLLSKKTIRVEI